jgi:hypothetical protein
VLAAAALLADNATLAWLLVARCVFDVADALAAFGVGYAAVAFPALVMAVFSAAAAWWLFRHAGEPPVRRRAATAATAE